MTAPKLFISYCWSSPDHEQRVLDLATELRESGVEAILDKWDLREGQDAHAFMESMVTDPTVTKVLLVCDLAYVEKANSRAGGVGIETQILTPELYKTVDQTKFVALVLERDENGKPLVPAYYSSRIHIDYSESAKQSDSFDQLLRWAFDKPLHQKPKLGTMPVFLADNSAPTISTTAALRRVVHALREGRGNWSALCTEYLEVFATQMENFRVSDPEEPRDEPFMSNIEAFTPYRNEVISLLDEVALHKSGSSLADLLHEFFERILGYNFRPPGTGSWRETDFDNFRFITHELFLLTIALLVRRDRFEEVSNLLDREYYCPVLADMGKTDVLTFRAFRGNIQLLDHRNERLNLHRLSLHADTLKSRCVDIPVTFQQMMQVDFLLFLRGASEPSGWGFGWWPATLVYASDSFASRFEVFARSRSKNYFSKIAPLLGVKSLEQFKETVVRFQSGELKAPKWQFETLNVAALCGLDELGIRS